MSAPFSVSEELLPIERIKFRRPLAPRTLTAQVYRATIGSKDYAVKLVSASWRYIHSIHLTGTLVPSLQQG